MWGAALSTWSSTFGAYLQGFETDVQGALDDVMTKFGAYKD